VIAAVNENPRQNPCLACPGHCCSQNLINLCGYDVWVIATGLSVEPTSFLAFAQLEVDSPYHFRLDGSEKAYCLALNMKEWNHPHLTSPIEGEGFSPEVPDGSRRCIFLMELPSGQTRCGIYGLRPIACRAYPLVLTENGAEVKPWAMCPESGHTLNQRDGAFWQAELERHDMEFSIYALVVETWNGKGKDQPAIRELNFRPFLAFLMEAYGRLEPARRAVPEESWPRIWNRWRRFTAEGLNPLLARAGDPEADESWHRWLHEIRKAVADSAEGIGGSGVESSKRCEETLV
jgi:Fe-S-cluster containining protein